MVGKQIKSSADFRTQHILYTTTISHKFQSALCRERVCNNIVIYHVVYYPMLLKCKSRTIYYINDVIIK